MRMSASGLESTIAVAIDQILRLAPSIKPPIDPVVSKTKATSTVGFAMADDRPADSGSVARANASERSVKPDFMVLLLVFRPSEPRFRGLHGGVRPKTRRGTYKFAADSPLVFKLDSWRWAALPKSARLEGWNRPPARSRSSRPPTAASRR